METFEVFLLNNLCITFLQRPDKSFIPTDIYPCKGFNVANPRLFLKNLSPSNKVKVLLYFELYYSLV